MQRLIRELRYAARFGHLASARRVAARAANDIPQTIAEKMRTVKGHLAFQARAIMRGLPFLSDEDFECVRAELKFLADALDGGTEIVSETHLGKRKRGRP